MKTEIEELSDKEFIEKYIPFTELKKVGFFGNDIKRKDHAKIVERFLLFFGQTKREYILNQPYLYSELHNGFVTGHGPSSIDKDGNLIPGGGFHITFGKS